MHLFESGLRNFPLISRMTFANEKLDYDPKAGNTILDYKAMQSDYTRTPPIFLILKTNSNLLQVRIKPLKEEDTIVPYGEAGNYSVTGFEITLTRNVEK